MRNASPASFLASVLLHAGLLALLLISIQLAPKTLPASSVPVEIVSEVPSHEMAAAPVDEQAVQTPVPTPAEEEQPKPEPEPVPAPPQKAVAPPAPKPEPKPTPVPPKTQTPPDKKGTQKPAPQKPAKPEPAPLDLKNLMNFPSASSNSPTRKLPKASPRPTDGPSSNGGAPQEAGVKTALDALTQKLARLWSPNCDVPGGNKIVPEIMFTLSPNGRVIKGPEWLNKNADSVWVAGANRAMAAVAKGQPYDDLPPGLYNVPLKIKFDARKACQTQ